MSGSGQCFMWELVSWGRTLHDRVDWLLNTDRSIPQPRPESRDPSRGGHLMVQSLNTFINSLHFAPRRQGFESIHEVFVTH